MQTCILDSLAKGKVYVTQDELCWFWWSSRHLPLENIQVEYNPNFKEIVSLTSYDNPTGEEKVLLVCYSSSYIGYVEFIDYKPSSNWTIIIAIPKEKKSKATGGNYIELKLKDQEWFKVPEVHSKLQLLDKKDRDRFLEDFKDQPTRGIVQLRKKNPLDYPGYKEEEYLKDLLLKFFEDYSQLKPLIERPTQKLYAWYYTTQLKDCTLCNVLTAHRYTQNQKKDETANAGVCRDLWCYYEILVKHRREIFRNEPGLGAKLFLTWVSLASSLWAEKDSPGLQINKKTNKGRLYHFVRFCPSEKAIHQFRKLLR